MMALVTGAAGFIGSHLCESLLAAGDRVCGVDSLTPYYDVAQKRANLAAFAGSEGAEVVEADLRHDDIAPLLDGVDAVFHQAGQPGVRLSWAEGFTLYSEHNILATQRLLEAVKASGVTRLVYASSSSVYGNAAAYPTAEDDLPAPHSPYGVTKLAAEHLCGLYARNWGVPTVSLRYFTVFGPRQRPDMAIHRLFEAGIAGEAFPLFGGGEQVRDFTYVGDVVAANLAAATADVAPGTVVNVAGGGSITMNALIETASDVLGHPIDVAHQPAQAGDVDRTGGSIDRARRLLGWEPEVALRAGLEAQARWHLERGR